MVITLTPPPMLDDIRPRQRVPTSFLKSLETLHELAGTQGKERAGGRMD